MIFDPMLIYGIGMLAFGVAMLPFLAATWGSVMADVDYMIERFEQNENCEHLLFMKDLIDDRPLADISRPDMKEVLEKRIIELNCTI